MDDDNKESPAIDRGRICHEEKAVVNNEAVEDVNKEYNTILSTRRLLLVVTI